MLCRVLSLLVPATGLDAHVTFRSGDVFREFLQRILCDRLVSLGIDPPVLGNTATAAVPSSTQAITIGALVVDTKVMDL
jgi:hypothetical protein